MTLFSFFNDPAPSEIYTLSLHDALPIWNPLKWSAWVAGSTCSPTSCLAACASAWAWLAPWQPEPTFSSRSEEHTSELQSRGHLVCRLLLEKKKNITCHISCIICNTRTLN